MNHLFDQHSLDLSHVARYKVSALGIDLINRPNVTFVSFLCGTSDKKLQSIWQSVLIM